MSDNEDIGEIKVPVKEKKPRTEAQIRATERMLEKRREVDAIKREHREALKTEKQLKLNDKKIKIKEVEDKQLQQKLSEYVSEPDEEEEVIVKPKKLRETMPKKKTKVIYRQESSSDEEIVIVKPKKKQSVKKKIVYRQQSESEEEEIVQTKTRKHSVIPERVDNNLTENVNRTSQEQLKYDLHTERMMSAMRSLGYIQ